MSRTTLVLLPGLDGTGDLFAPVVDALGASVPTQIVRYPLSHASDYATCEAIARTALHSGRLLMDGVCTSASPYGVTAS